MQHWNQMKQSWGFSFVKDPSSLPFYSFFFFPPFGLVISCSVVSCNISNSLLICSKVSKGLTLLSCCFLPPARLLYIYFQLIIRCSQMALLSTISLFIMTKERRPWNPKYFTFCVIFTMLYLYEFCSFQVYCFLKFKCSFLIFVYFFPRKTRFSEIYSYECFLSLLMYVLHIYIFMHTIRKLYLNLTTQNKYLFSFGPCWHLFKAPDFQI